MKWTPILKWFAILLVADVFFAGVGGYAVFTHHGLWYDNPFLFLVTIILIMGYLKAQLFLISMAVKDAYEPDDDEQFWRR